jgi:hypothetical protein
MAISWIAVASSPSRKTPGPIFVKPWRTKTRVNGGSARAGNYSPLAHTGTHAGPGFERPPRNASYSGDAKLRRFFQPIAMSESVYASNER